MVALSRKHANVSADTDKYLSVVRRRHRLCSTSLSSKFDNELVGGARKDIPPAAASYVTVMDDSSKAQLHRSIRRARALTTKASRVHEELPPHPIRNREIGRRGDDQQREVLVMRVPPQRVQDLPVRGSSGSVKRARGGPEGKGCVWKWSLSLSESTYPNAGLREQGAEEHDVGADGEKRHRGRYEEVACSRGGQRPGHVRWR